MDDRSTFLDRILPCWGSARDRRNYLRYMAACVTFALSWAGVSLLIVDGTIRPGWPAGLAVCLPGSLGLVVVWAFVRFLRATDELLRRIQLEGLAWGFAAGLVWAVGWSLARRAGLPDTETMDVAAVMVCAYAIGVSVAAARYGAQP